MRCVSEVFPCVGCYVSVKKILTKIHKIEVQDKYSLPPELERLANLPSWLITVYFDKEKQRKDIIERKARINALAVTLAVTLFSAAVSGSSCWFSFLDSGADGLRLTLDLLNMAGFLFFAYGGYAAIRALRADRFWDIDIHEEVELQANREHRRILLVKYLFLNQHQSNIRANYLETSYLAIRNGLLCLVAFLVASIAVCHL